MQCCEAAPFFVLLWLREYFKKIEAAPAALDPVPAHTSKLTYLS
jgi:hypothetical protein